MLLWLTHRMVEHIRGATENGKKTQKNPLIPNEADAIKETLKCFLNCLEFNMLLNFAYTFVTLVFIMCTKCILALPISIFCSQKKMLPMIILYFYVILIRLIFLFHRIGCIPSIVVNCLCYKLYFFFWGATKRNRSIIFTSPYNFRNILNIQEYLL